mmetsp:Transcript_12255/g.42510  ORF Transcript_12255/g.42510 Transcript_12255/m.42510 type:complete len:1092 (+) Transcript_12255:149-3424(+)
MASYQVDADTLQTMVTERDTLVDKSDPSSAQGKAELAKLGGVSGLAAKLKTDLEKGVSGQEAELASRREALGTNEFEYPPPKTLLELVGDAFNDLTVRILCVAAIVSLGIGAGMKEHREEYGYLEGIAIIVVVWIVVGLQAGIDYTKERKFRKLNSVKDNYDVKVLRNGQPLAVPANDIVVGDLVTLTAGDKLPADGVFVAGSKLKTNESAMTGEPIDIAKNADKDPFLLSGTTVSEGSGTMLAVAVGSRSQWGAIIKQLVQEPEDTPLQDRLNELVVLVGNFGMGSAILTFIASMIRWTIHGAEHDDWEGVEVLDFLINSVTIVVVAIPEGLPLAITLGLAFAMRKMMQDQNLVRKLEACETMGSATQLNADKTGTLTQNRMTVMEVWTSGTIHTTLPPPGLSKEYTDLLAKNMALNSDANLSMGKNGRIEHLGNKTECALLQFVEQLGHNYKSLRDGQPVLHRFHFTSASKRMSTAVREGEGKQRLHVKGASEIVVALCKKIMHVDGSVHPLSKEEAASAMEAITKMGNEGLRTLCLAYCDLSKDENDESQWEQAPADDLTLISLVGIKDPIRPETKEAVRLLRGAGVNVRMVTGDNPLTAASIAKEAGILDEGGLVLEGPDFRKMSEEEKMKVALHIQVLARSSPTDKEVLCSLQRKMGEVVSVTGDGTNDAPALKAADVGFALGLAGTEIAKEACDIIIMDDNIKSMAAAVLWGRNVFYSIRKFLQFQLVVNVVAVTLNLVSACAGVELPLAAVPLLWVNMIMDSLGALALATEPPSPSLMDRKPFGRTAPLVNKEMVRNIVGIAIYQLIVCFVLLFAGQSLFGLECTDKDRDQIYDLNSEGELVKHEVKMDKDDCPGTVLELNSIIFNTFVFMQIFSEINSRKIEDRDIFSKIQHSPLFCMIILATAVVQLAFIQGVGATVVGQSIGFVDINGIQWMWSIILGIFVLPLGYVARLTPLHWYPGKADEDVVNGTPVDDDDLDAQKAKEKLGSQPVPVVESSIAGQSFKALSYLTETVHESSAPRRNSRSRSTSRTSRDGGSRTSRDGGSRNSRSQSFESARGSDDQGQAVVESRSARSLSGASENRV